MTIAEPAMTIEREPKVPVPYGTRPVSPSTSSIMREGHAEPGREHLRERRGVRLAVAVRAAHHEQAAVGGHADVGGIEEARARAEHARVLRRRHARAFDEVADAEPPEQSALRGRLPARGKAGVVGELERALEQFREIAGVVGRSYGGRVRHCRRRDEVLAPELEAVEAEPRRRLLDEALEDVARLGTPSAPVGVGGHGIGEEDAHVDGDRGDPVGAGEDAGVHGGRDRRPDGRDVAARGRERRDPQSEKAPVGVERELGASGVVARLVIADEGLAPGRHPFERPPQLARGPRERGFLGVVLALGAEAAADVRCDDAHRVFGNGELLGDELPDVVRDLRRRVDHDLVAVEPAGRRGDGHDRARLDRGAGDAVVDELEGDDVLRLGEGRLGGGDVAALEAHDEVAGGLRVELGRVGLRRVAHVDDRRQRRPVDRHELRGVERLIARSGNHHSDRLADVAHALARERPARRLVHSRAVGAGNAPQRCHRPDAVGGHVGAGVDGDDARRGGGGLRVDAVDAGVRVRRTHERARELAFEHEIANELSLADEKAQVFAAAHRRADTFRMHRDSRGEFDRRVRII